MKWVGIFLVMLSLSAYSAGLNSLLHDNKTPLATAPKPRPPTAVPTLILAPKSAPPTAVAPKPAAPVPTTTNPTNSNNPTTDNNKTCSPTDLMCKR